MTRNDHTKSIRTTAAATQPCSAPATPCVSTHQPHHDQHACTAHHAGASTAPARRRWGALRRGAVRFAAPAAWCGGCSGARRSPSRSSWSPSPALWWRLASGPIEFDMATPWLKAAIEENFGGKHTVSVGGTQIERDENGRTVVAPARHRGARRRRHRGRERAESGSGHFRHRPAARARCARAASIWSAPKWRCASRPTARVTVFAGADKRPIATASPAPAAGRNPTGRPMRPRRRGRCAPALQDLAGVLAWIDGLGATGLDGHDLRELGLKNGNLTVDDQRNGKHWTFSRINVSLMRPPQGGRDLPPGLGKSGAALGAERRHAAARATACARSASKRAMFRRATFCWPCVSTKAISKPNLPLSASVRAEISSDGTLQRLQGQVVAERGTIIDHGDDDIERDDRPRRRPLQLGCAAARAGRSVSDPVRRQSVHHARNAGGARRPERRLAVQRGARRPGDRSGDSGVERANPTRRALRSTG